MEDFINIDSNKLINVQKKEELPKKNTETLMNLVETAVKKSGLGDYIYVRSDEVTQSSQSVKQIFVEGRAPIEKEEELNNLQIELFPKISAKLGYQFDINKFWKVNCGLTQEDTFYDIEVVTKEGEKKKIVHEEGKVLIINIWSIFNGFSAYLDFNNLIMKNIIENKIEGVKQEDVMIVSISGEENISYWKKIAEKVSYSEYVPQYYNKNVYEIFGLTQSPSVILINSKGKVKYIGAFKNFDYEKDLPKLLKGDEDLEKSEFKEKDAEHNKWWSEMDAQSKVDIVRDINVSLREMGLYNAQFMVITKSINKGGKNICITTPVFVGKMYEPEYEIIQGFAIELQNCWNFTNFTFNISVL